MAIVSIEKIQLRRGMAADLPGQPTNLVPPTFSPGLDQGEFGYTVDLGRLFIGIGSDRPVPGMANYQRTQFPYQNVEVLTENSPLARIVGGVMSDNQTGFQRSAPLLETATFVNLQVLDALGGGQDFYLDLPNGGGVNALIFYFVYHADGTALRSGRLTVVWTPAMLYPLCTDEAQADSTTYADLQFQATTVAAGTAQHLVLQYINQTNESPYIWFSITRPSFDGLWVQPTVPAPIIPPIPTDLTLSIISATSMLVTWNTTVPAIPTDLTLSSISATSMLVTWNTTVPPIPTDLTMAGISATSMLVAWT